MADTLTVMKLLWKVNIVLTLYYTLFLTADKQSLHTKQNVTVLRRHVRYSSLFIHPISW